MTNRRLSKSLKRFSNKKEERVIPISGTLGIPLGGQKLVEVPNRKGFVYVRLKDNTSEIIQAYNSEVSTIYGLAVLVSYQNNSYKVIGRDLDKYRDWGNIPYLPKHGGQHSFNQAFGMGADVTWIYSQQMMPLLVYPSGTSSGLGNNVIVAPHIVRGNDGSWKYVGNTGTASFSPYIPTTPSGAVMALVYIDEPSGNPFLLINSGTVFSNSITGSSQISQYIPALPNPATQIPLAAVRLVTGTTQIAWQNIYDVRQWVHTIPTGTGGGVSSIAVQDEAVPQGNATTFNFTGNGVQASVSGSVATVNVVLSTGSSVAIVEDITSQVSGTVTRFLLSRSVSPNGILLLYNGLGQEYGVHFLVSGSVVDTLFTPTTGSTLQAVEMGIFATGSSQTSFSVQDEGIIQGDATVLNFVGGGIDATISGSVARVFVTGSSSLGDIPLVVANTGTYSNLLNGVYIPGLSASPDRSLLGSTTGTYEGFDTSNTGLTWNSTPDTVDSNSTIKSHLYIKATTNTEYLGTKSWTPPSGTVDARAKVLIGNGVSNAASIGLHVGNSGNTSRTLIILYSIPASQVVQIRSYTYAGGAYTQRGGNWSVNSNEIYLRVVRESNSSISLYFSTNGILWQLVSNTLVGTFPFFTINNVGFRITQDSPLTHETASDWLWTFP